MKKRKRTSPIWKLETREFKKLVERSESLSEILIFFGLRNIGGNFRTLKERLHEENIDYAHIIEKRLEGYRANLRRFNNPLPLEKILVENSTYSRHYLKKRLIKDNIIPYKCNDCGLAPFWNNKKLSLQLEHKNGRRDDHRIKNLCFLCPNCHSQTDTFAGKNYVRIRKIKGMKKKTNKCVDCSVPIGRKSTRCRKCSSLLTAITRRKVKIRPSLETLKIEVKEMGYRATGRKYNVSDNAIKKWMAA